MKTMNIWKVIIVSAIVSANITIGYEVFGIGFLIGLGVIIACVVAFSWGK